MTRLFEEPTQTIAGRFAHVAPEQGLDASAGGLTYAIPQALADLQVGQRVTVPLGRGDKSVAGFVLELVDHTDLDPRKVKPILTRDATGISLTRDLVDLATWIAGYYCCPIGMVFATMLPAAVKKGTGRVSQVMIGLAPPPPLVQPTEARTSPAEVAPPAPAPTSTAPPEGDAGAAEDAKPPRKVRLSNMQKAVLAKAREALAAGRHWTEIKALADEAGARGIAPVRQLVEKGLLIARQQDAVLATRGAPLGLPGSEDLDAPAPGSPGTLGTPDSSTVSPPLVLNDDQRRAIDRIANSVHAGFGVHLLHGVTGSGKTEVYLRVLEELLRTATPRCDAASGEEPDPIKPGPPIPNSKFQTPNSKSPPSAIVLVPEIALTPQTVARFVARFDSVAVMHSGLTAAQRHEQWRRIHQGEARVVVGARSAVFAPLENVRLIIVDEEHEHSYKQDQLPRYQARDVAIRRAQLLGVPVLLGSATPSLESYYNATEGPNKKNYHLDVLPQRVAGQSMPSVEIVDMKLERRKRYEYSGSGGVHLLSIRLEKVLEQALAAKGQAILLLNRRGYANYIACPDHRCGWMMNCELCDATMVYHKDAALPVGGLVRCHHCTAEQLLPATCPTCGKKVTVFGLGTQRVEEEVGRKFPTARLLRMDSDVMRTGRDYHRSFESFRRGEVDVLVGTQMIAKGLDFPNVHAVGVISADTALNMPDFRAGERTFQLISQVAGRAGRGGKDNPGRVIVQSFCPSDPAIVLAAAHDYEAFAKRELDLRRQVGLPPITRMARIVVRDQDHLACVAQATKLGDALASFNAQMGNAVRLRGPSACPIGRIAGFYRQQVEMIAPDAATLQKLLTAARNARVLHADARTAVDVDPVALM